MVIFQNANTKRYDQWQLSMDNGMEFHSLWVWLNKNVSCKLHVDVSYSIFSAFTIFYVQEMALEYHKFRFEMLLGLIW